MGINKVKLWQLEHHVFLKLRIKSYSNLIPLALLCHTTLWPLLGKTPSVRAGICFSYRTFIWEENTSNIFITIFWSLNREIYQGVVTLVGQQKNFFCSWLKICAFEGCLSGLAHLVNISLSPSLLAAAVSVTAARANCMENSLQCSHLGKIPFPCKQSRSHSCPGGKDCSRTTCLCFQWQLWVQPEAGRDSVLF